jgi:hypothetical protein
MSMYPAGDHDIPEMVRRRDGERDAGQRSKTKKTI